MKFTVRHTFNTDVETYWNKLFFDPEYNERLYKHALGFNVFELIELTGEPGGKRTRKLLTEPKSDAPAVVRKLIGDSLQYTETGSFDGRGLRCAKAAARPRAARRAVAPRR